MKVIKENKFIFPMLLFLLPLWNVWIGVDVVDTAYSLTYFRFFDQLDGMWYSATFLANFIGSALMKLPFGEYQLGMNIYTSLLIGIGAAIIYQLLSAIFPKMMVFIGEVLAITICWCPMMILYHSLTYILFSLSAAFLIYGMVKQKNRYLYIVGVILGINLFVRMPSNAVQIILIVVVWYASFLRKQSFKETMKQTLYCVLGYLCAVAVVGMLIALVYGINPYIDGIISMLGASENASDYTLVGMVYQIVRILQEGAMWLLRLIPFLVLGVIIQFICGKKWIRIKCLLGAFVGIIGMYILMRQNFFDRNYFYYHSVFLLYLVVVILVILSCLWYIFDKRKKDWEKITAAAVLLITIVMPFGTNNQFYANMNNMFLVFPYFIFVCFKVVKYTLAKKNLILLGICSTSSAFFVVFIVQVLLFGGVFVFKDNEVQMPRNYEMQQIQNLKGVFTNEENGIQLEEIYFFLEANNLLEQLLITYGNLPGLYYYLDMSPASSVVWPDLGTSPQDIWERDIKAASKQNPVIIINSSLQDIFTLVEINDKEKIIKQYLTENKYTLRFANDKYLVFWNK